MKALTRHFLFLSALVILFLVLATNALAAPGNVLVTSEPVRMTFAKTDPDGNFVWNGAVSGDVEGALQTVLLEARPSDKILHVVFDWIVTGSCSFTARLSGTLDTGTGKVTMNGTVIEGCYEGAQVHEEGQLVDGATSGFAGTIRIMPTSAD